MAKNESPMMKQFNELKAKHPEAILLFRCGDFYETYEEDAKACAKVLGITLTEHKDGHKMAGFPHHALDGYLPKLIRAGKRVAICDQLEDPKLTKKLVKRGISETINELKSETTMAKNLKAADLIGKTVSIKGSDAKYVIKSVDGDKLMTDFYRAKDAQPMPCPLPWATMESKIAEGIYIVEGDAPKAAADEVEEVDEIKVEQPKAKPKTGKLTFSTYQNGQKTLGRISGFGADDPAYVNGRDFHGSPYPVKGVLCLSFGKAYKDFAKQLCDALNQGKSMDECRKMLEQYDVECAQKREEWRAKREERKAAADAAPNGKTYTEEYMADLLNRAMKKEPEAMAEINAIMSKKAA